MQFALVGTNTTRPFGATTAPLNFSVVLMVALMSTQLKALVAGLNVPTQSAF